MKNNKSLLITAMLIFISWGVFSQKTLYFMDRLPQTVQYNPALMPHENFYLALPGIGNGSAEIMNSGFKLGEFLDFLDKTGDPGYDPEKFIRSIGDYNKTFAEANVNLISFGFKTGKKGYFSFSWSERNFIGIKSPSNGLYLTEKYEKIRNKLPFTINGVDIQLNSFTQMAVTYSRKIGSKLTLGITPKLVYAAGGIQTENISIKASDSGDESVKVSLKGDMHLGLPGPINPFAINSKAEWNTDKSLLADNWFDEYRQNSVFKNAGFAVDLGAGFILNDKWSFSVSLTDIGATHWKNNVYLLTTVDSVTKVRQEQTLKLTIPSKLYVAARYRLSDKWDTGLLFRNLTTGLGPYTSATLSLNGVVGKILTTSVSYTVPGSLGSLGLGFCVRFFPGMDLYVVTDDILSAFSYRNISHMALAAGVNLAIGVKNTNR
jgi:hypothetical protein